MSKSKHGRDAGARKRHESVSAWGSVGAERACGAGKAVAGAVGAVSVVGLLAMLGVPGVPARDAEALEAASGTYVDVAQVLSLRVVGQSAFQTAVDNASGSTVAEKVAAAIGGEYSSVSSIDIDAENGLFATTMNGGTADGSGATVIASTNTSKGYSLTVTDVDADTALQGRTYGSADQKINTLASATSGTDETDSEETFSTDNTWGYALSEWGNSYQHKTASSLDFKPIKASDSVSPDVYTTSTLGAKAYDFNVGVKVGEALPADVYEDTVMFTLVANPDTPSSATIFDITTMQEMTASTCSNTPTPYAWVSSGTYSDTAPYVYDDDASSGSIVATAGTQLSDFSAAEQAGTVRATKVPTATLTDARDGETYTVRKLADGNCWMTQNLRLGQNGPIHLTPAKSDITSTTGRANGFDLPASVKYANWSDTITGWADATMKYTAISMDGDSNSSWAGRNYGVLYNWYTATAGAKSSTGTDLIAAGSGEAADSICPAGWKLPKDNTGSDYSDKSWSKLMEAYGVAGYNHNTSTTSPRTWTQAEITAERTRMTSDPLSVVYAGYFNYSTGALFNQGSYANLWTSRVNYASYSRLLNASTTYVAPRYNSSKGYGFSVRCVAAS